MALKEILIHRFHDVEDFGIHHRHVFGILGIYVAFLCVVLSFAPFSQRKRKQPPVLPYKIPFIGHVFSFMKNSEDLFTYGRKYFGNTRDIFSLVMGGKIFHILTHPDHVTTMYRSADTLPFNVFFQEQLIQFGVSQDAAQAFFRHPLSAQSTKPGKSMADLAHDFQTKQARGQDLKKLAGHIIEFMSKNIFLENVLDGQLGTSSRTVNGIDCLSLKTWAAETVIHGVQDAYFGPNLLKFDPKLPEVVMEFDELSWQAFFSFPNWMRPRLNRLTRRLQSTFTEYFKLPASEREGFAWFTPALKNTFEDGGISEDDCGALMVFLYWGITTNISKATYWLMAHAVHKPELIDMIREETAPAFSSPDAVPDLDHLVNHCPKLNSIWLETLRMSASSTSIRQIVDDTPMGDYVLEKGRTIMVSARQLHVGNDSFGKDSMSFDPMRFYNDPSLHRTAGFRPFGGGKNLCPGRHLAKHTALGLVSMLLHRYDPVLAFPQSFPRYREDKPAIGVIGGIDDVYMTLKPRQE